MKISELKVGQDKVEVEGTVKDISETREFNKFGRNIRVATAALEDESGDIKMSLWNQDIDKVGVGDKIKVSNGFVKEFQGEKQLTAGRFGKIEVLEKGKGVKKAKPEPEEKPEEVEEIIEEAEEEAEAEEPEGEEAEGEEF